MRERERQTEKSERELSAEFASAKTHIQGRDIDHTIETQTVETLSYFAVPTGLPGIALDTLALSRR